MRSKKAIYNTISGLVLQIIILIYGFIVPKIIISNYGSNVNGLVSSIRQFLAYIALLDSGFTSVVKSQLYKPIVDKNKKSINDILKSADLFFKRIAYVFIGYIVALSLFYPLLVNSTFEYWSTFLLIIILSISTFAEYYFGMVYKIYLQANQEGYIVSAIQMFTYILAIIFTIILSYFNVSIHILKLFTGFVFILRPLIQNIYIKKKYCIELDKADKNYKIKNKWDGLAQHFATVVHNNTDVTLLTLIGALSEISVYSVYSMVVSGIRSLIQSFSSGIDSTFGNMIACKETDNLNHKFSIYETIYDMILTTIFSCTCVLIVPFVKIYTSNITDVNYVRYTFGLLIVLSEYIWAVRQPYNELIKAAGHFKETKNGAWVECCVNILISVVLVGRFGLVGIAIGTLVAMAIRAIELVYRANKYILNRSILNSCFKISIIAIETIIIILVSNNFVNLQITGLLDWIRSAFCTFGISLFVTLLFNCTFFSKDLIYCFKEVKCILLKRMEA